MCKRLSIAHMLASVCSVLFKGTHRQLSYFLPGEDTIIPSMFVENMFKFTLKHKNTKIPHDVGYVNSGDLDDLSVLWVPVYADTEDTGLLSVYFNFEQGNWCSQMSLSSMSDHWIRDLSSSNIQFSCAHNPS